MQMGWVEKWECVTVEQLSRKAAGQERWTKKLIDNTGSSTLHRPPAILKINVHTKNQFSQAIARQGSQVQIRLNFEAAHKDSGTFLIS